MILRYISILPLLLLSSSTKPHTAGAFQATTKPSKVAFLSSISRPESRPLRVSTPTKTFVTANSPLSPSSSSPRLRPTTTTTALNVFQNDHDAVLRVASPWIRTKEQTSSSSVTLAMPMLLASAAAPLVSHGVQLSDLRDAAISGGSLLAPLLATMMSVTTDSTSGSAGAGINPLVEAEMLSDFQIVFDLVACFGPAKPQLRLAAVIARVMAMAADYIPDHQILPEQLVFQFFMIGIGVAGLLQSSLPTVLSWFSPQPMSLRDRKVYSALFSPLGMSWRQFKALSAFALDWYEAEPGQVITDEHQDHNDTDYVYWLYSGQVVASSNGKVLFDKRANSTSFRQEVGKRLIGENCLLHCVGSECSVECGDLDPFPLTTATAGPDGATLLRIHRRNLDLLMQMSDEEYTETMRKLVFQGFKDKLAARLSEA